MPKIYHIQRMLILDAEQVAACGECLTESIGRTFKISELQGWDLVTRAMAFLTLLLLPLACAVPGSATLPTEIEPLRTTDAVNFHEQADRHEEHEEHGEHEKHEDTKVEKSPAPAQHWWNRFWPFVLPATPTRSDVADAVQLEERNAHHREHEDQKGTVEHSAPGHWWDHLWPFGMSAQEEASQNSQLLADEQDSHFGLTRLAHELVSCRWLVEESWSFV